MVRRTKPVRRTIFQAKTANSQRRTATKCYCSFRRAREEGSAHRLHPADRLRQRGDGLGAGFDEKYGVKIIPTKEASWAGVRDKLVNGELDMAHVLYGLVYGVHLGVGGPKKDMAVLMT
jgi:hypothetical protein